ncbi:LuxR C-terminal-related transcriptional regulator [uncultured Schumannella sp.]|uniref:helix-turn-helix transcriptional regulator n=1 Tax=uncultured Schumannella sp. TaxID=1195956 RepID=UPI0025FCD3FD|nr:LuxR C-terminal-related transcriptional regulator [uncultured Schumannella sp.]
MTPGETQPDATDLSRHPRVPTLGIVAANAELRAELEQALARATLADSVAVSVGTWMETVSHEAFPTQAVVFDADDESATPSVEARVRASRAASARVIAVTRDVDGAAAERWKAAGAADIVTPEQLPAAVHALSGVEPGRAAEWHQSALQRAHRPKLSPGETQALKLYCSGLSTIEVGREMNVQYETAKTYLRRVREKYAKVGRPASKKIELIRRATEDGILEE